MVLDLFLVSSAKIMSKLGTLSLKIKLDFFALPKVLFFKYVSVFIALKLCHLLSFRNL
jgi:hypothetical protein